MVKKKKHSELSALVAELTKNIDLKTEEDIVSLADSSSKCDKRGATLPMRVPRWAFDIQVFFGVCCLGEPSHGQFWIL